MQEVISAAYIYRRSVWAGSPFFPLRFPDAHRIGFYSLVWHRALFEFAIRDSVVCHLTVVPLAFGAGRRALDERPTARLLDDDHPGGCGFAMFALRSLWIITSLSWTDGCASYVEAWPDVLGSS